MPITIETLTADAVVAALKQQLPATEWEKLPLLIEQANEMMQKSAPDEEEEFYAASRLAAARFFEDEGEGG